MAALEHQNQGKALKRELASYLREKDRAALQLLRARIKAARVDRRHALSHLRSICKTTAWQLKARHRVERQQMTVRHREEWAAFRADCAAKVAAAKASGAIDEKTRKRELKEAQELQRQFRRTANERKRSELTSLAEKRQESDDEVRANLTEELVPIFNAVGSKMRAKGKKTRTEAFLEWVHDNPEEAYAVQRAQSDKKLERMIAAHEELEQKARKPSRYQGTTDGLKARLTDPLLDFLGDADPTGQSNPDYLEQVALVVPEALGANWRGKYWAKGGKERVYITENGKQRGFLVFGPEMEIDTKNAMFPSALRKRVPDLIDNVLSKY